MTRASIPTCAAFNAALLAFSAPVAGCGNEPAAAGDTPISALCGWPGTSCDRDEGKLVNCGGLFAKVYPCTTLCAVHNLVSHGCVDLPEPNGNGWSAECVCRQRDE